MRTRFEKRLQSLQSSHKELLHKANKKLESDNGIFFRYASPVLTVRHTHIFWRYDLNYETNPYMMERFGIDAVLSASAIKLNGRYLLIAELRGSDSKSFFTIAESANGTDNFEFWDYPLTIPETGEAGTTPQDLRIVHHEDGWLYGIFSIAAKDPQAFQADRSPVMLRWGIARTIDLKTWERLPDLQTSLLQQHNIILHPEFINGKYAFYLHQPNSIMDAGELEKVELGLSDTIISSIIEEETMSEQKVYNPIHVTNDFGPAPIKTQYGWLHLVRTVSNAAAGLNNVLRMFMTDLKNPTSIIYKPAGYFIAPECEEKAGNIFCNGWILSEDGMVYIYYGYSDDRLRVASSTLDQLLDYVMNTSQNGPGASRPVNTLHRIIDNNKALMQLKQPREKSAH